MSNIDDLNGQRTNMVKQTRELFDKLVSKAKNWLDGENTLIDTHYQEQLSVLKQIQTNISNAISRIKSSLGEIDIGIKQYQEVLTRLYTELSYHLFYFNIYKILFRPHIPLA